MKFVALLMISAVAADAEPKEVDAGASCKDVKTTKCKATDCCGTVSDIKATTVKVGDATSLFKDNFATVCSTKPTADETKETEDADKKKVPGVGASVIVVKKVDEVKDATSGDVTTAAVVEVKGTFLCNAADADAGAASYMTVGAAAIIAAATLLQ